MKKDAEMETAINTEVEVFKALKYDADEIVEILTENLDGEELAQSDLPRISQKNDSFIIPFGSGEQVVKSFEGIIIAKNYQRAYWRKGYDEAPDQDPDCVSRDDKTGTFNPESFGPEENLPSGNCKDCPFSKFESGKNGGQACQKSYKFLVLLKDAFLPFVMRIPVGSITNAKKFFTSLSSEFLHYCSVIINFSTQEEKSSTGIKYDSIKISTAKVLTEDERGKVKALNHVYKQKA